MSTPALPDPTLPDLRPDSWGVWFPDDPKQVAATQQARAVVDHVVDDRDAHHLIGDARRNTAELVRPDAPPQCLRVPDDAAPVYVGRPRGLRVRCASLGTGAA